MARISKDFSGWFPYPDDPDGAEVHVRLPKKGEVDRIIQETIEYKTTRDISGGAPEISMKHRGARRGIAIAATKEWKLFFDEDGNSLVCGNANILKMCDEGGYIEFIDACIEELENRKIKEAEKTTKN